MTDNKIMNIKVDEETIDKIQRLFLDYESHKDAVMSYMDLHKFDEDGSALKAPIFKELWHDFQMHKYAYDTAMIEIQMEYIPEDVRNKGLRFEVDFDNYQMILHLQ